MNNKIAVFTFVSPVGEIILGSYDGALCLADWKYRKMRKAIDSRISKNLNAEFVAGETPVITEAINQLTAYFNGERTVFELPLNTVGTPFQKQVWKALQEIPYGQTQSYLQLSKSLDNEKAVRAVAAANGANAISIIIPCHRIIGANGNLVGYAGGLPAKKKLLKLEDALATDQMSLF